MFLKIIEFLTKHLLIIHKGTLIAKVKSLLSLSLSLSPFAYGIEKITNWTLENEAYVVFVLGAIVVDHILGSAKHLFVQRDFSLKENLIGLIKKVGLVITVGFLFEGVNYIVQGESFVKNYTIIVLRLAVFLYPAGSAFWNSYIITNGKFPPVGFIDAIKKFNVNLDLRSLKEPSKPNT
ncbi:hypothetical protein [Aquimarina aggregata]|uniref:hypothetical protein n=1 Tax=Aquimarina aggregata TaxID=1642818 RepID=UPI0024901ADF|nr:hypothetical protein [Aquimarina aggregata]